MHQNEESQQDYGPLIKRSIICGKNGKFENDFIENTR